MVVVLYEDGNFIICFVRGRHLRAYHMAFLGD